MAEGLCLGARAGKAVALPIQNEFLRYFKNNTLILFKTAIFWFKINISTIQNYFVHLKVALMSWF